MRDLGLRGVVRGWRLLTTMPDETPRPLDLVQHDFHPAAPNRLWVADLTYLRTWSGFAYVAFIIDAFSRYIVGWHLALTAHRPRAHRSGAGAVASSTCRFAIPSVWRRPASPPRGQPRRLYDNAMAETIDGLYKAELVYRRGL